MGNSCCRQIRRALRRLTSKANQEARNIASAANGECERVLGVTLQHSKYICTFCGKTNVKRVGARTPPVFPCTPLVFPATGIWKCGSCGKTQSGGAYELKPPAVSL